MSFLVIHPALAKFEDASSISSPNETLNAAFRLRSSDRQTASTLYERIDKTKLSDAEKDTYDYLSGFFLFMNQDVEQSILSFEALSKNAHTDKGRFDANTALGSLYAATQNWSKGLIILETILEKLPSIDDVTSLEQAHLAVSNLYEQMGEEVLLADYLRAIPEKPYSERFSCLLSVQSIAIFIKVDIQSVKDSQLEASLDQCKKAEEPVGILNIYNQQAHYYFNLGEIDKALEAIYPYIDDVKALNYQPLIDDYNSMMSSIYFEKTDYVKAQYYALQLFDETDINNLGLEANIISHEVLFKIALAQENYKDALDYYQKFATAKSLNISAENAKVLSIQKAKQNTKEKINQISLLNAENSLLRTKLALDEQEANVRMIAIVAMLTLIILSAYWVHKRNRYYRVLRRHAQQDSLTKIANRRYFTTEAEDMLRQCEQTDASISFILVDLDDFKLINDQHGHQLGDDALVKTANILQTICKDDGLVGRLGGEEFGIILKGYDEVMASSIAEECRDALWKTNQDPLQAYNLSASFGVAQSLYTGYKLKSLFASADIALYEAKNKGKNKVVTQNINQVNT